MDRHPDLNPEARALLESFDERDTPDLADMSPAEARSFFAEWRAEPVDVPALASVVDRTIPAGAYASGAPDRLPARVYTPEGEGPFPTLVYFHGGGWVVGSLDTVDGICRILAERAGCVVVSVGYRLAPEHPFPEPVADAVGATAWVNEHTDALAGDGRVAVGGDSAGGNLAAAVALHARETDGPELDHQLLVYPVVAPDDEFPSYEENAEGYYLEREDVAYFRDHYYEYDLERANPYAAPLSACSHADLPPATVVTCGFDPLRDEGAAYADALESAGVPVTHLRYPSLIHGVCGMLGEDGLAAGREVLADAAEALREEFEE